MLKLALKLATIVKYAKTQFKSCFQQ